jgi:inward rectifier potassium channel
VASEDPNRDLGFGAVVTRESRRRLLNRDGSFNVVREGLSFFASLSPYHFLLTVSWPRFLALVAGFYMAANVVFGLAYFACGPGALSGLDAVTPGQRLAASFFFSVQTFATIGYGQIAPSGLAANLLVTLESLVGLLGFALATGILFARFSRPTAHILFSESAVIAPYRGITAFEFRIANGRSNQILELVAEVLLSRFRDDGGREFLPLKLERDRVTFLPLSWTIVHPIDAASPLYGLTEEDLAETGAEFLILLEGVDETFSQAVQARSSYRASEVVWGAKFANIFNPPTPDGVLSIDVGRLHQIEPQALPEPPRPRRLTAST